MNRHFHRFYTNENNLSGIPGVNEDMYQHIFKHAWQVELNYNLVTTGHPEWNTRLMACRHNLTAAVQKSFLKDNALTLRLEAKDVLGMTQEDVTIDYGYSVLQQQKRHDNRRICLSLRYSL